MPKDGTMVEFAAGNRPGRGYLALPADASGKHAALVVVQEWWGLNDHIKDIANRFAAQGYVALAPDLYDGVATKDAGEAGRLMQGLDQKRALAILDGAVEFLANDGRVDPERIGITGFCMGGTYALLMASHNAHIKASVPFYGDVPDDSVLQKLSAPVLFFGADQDQWITTDKMDRLNKALGKYHKKGEVKVYHGVGHAFFNDTRPEAYDKPAAQDAWKRATAFLAENLKA